MATAGGRYEREDHDFGAVRPFFIAYAPPVDCVPSGQQEQDACRGFLQPAAEYGSELAKPAASSLQAWQLPRGRARGCAGEGRLGNWAARIRHPMRQSDAARAVTALRSARASSPIACPLACATALRPREEFNRRTKFFSPRAA